MLLQCRRFPGRDTCRISSSATAVPSTPRNCRRCDRSLHPRLVQADNPNGDVSRPYYSCVPYRDVESGRGWMTWDDAIGIRDSNPRCDCGTVSRQDQIGVNGVRRGMGFWVCASGSCNYYSEDLMGRTKSESRQVQAFRPWLL
jgi:hypothetical protein